MPYIHFGKGTIEKIGNILTTYGSKILIVASKSVLNQSLVESKLEQISTEHKIVFENIIIQGEPDVEQIDQGLDKGRNHKSQAVIGLGGGSAIDAGKAIAGLLTNGGSAIDYMEVVGKGKKITKQSLPYIAVPTTAGTGSEVTKNAVILSKNDGVKASIRSPLLVPKTAIIDPLLMASAPKDVTASCGLDALTQLIEAYTSIKAQPLTDALAIQGIECASKSLLFAFEDGNDISARKDMAYASLLSGICLANAGLGAVHGFASPVGGMFSIPHGVICAALLAPVIEENIRNMISQVPFSEALTKYNRIGEIVSNLIFEDIREGASRVIEYTQNITKLLKIPKLSKYGLAEKDFDKIIEMAKLSSSMRYNRVVLSDESLYRILKKTL